MIDQKTMERLTAYLDNILPVQEKAAVEALLSRDAELRTALKELKALRASLKDLPLQTPPDSFYDRVWRDIDEAPTPAPRRWSFPYRTVGAFAALALVVVATKEFWSPGRRGPAALSAPSPLSAFPSALSTQEAVRERQVTPLKKARGVPAPAPTLRKSVSPPSKNYLEGGADGGIASMDAAEKSETAAPSPVLDREVRSRGAEKKSASEIIQEAGAPSAADIGSRKLPIFSQLKGQKSGITSSLQTVIKSEREWEALWKRHLSGRPAPSFDFSKITIVAVFLGQKPTGGYNVQIKEIKTENGRILILYQATQPAAGATTTQALTSPFHIAVIPRVGGKFEFISN